MTLEQRPKHWVEGKIRIKLGSSHIPPKNKFQIEQWFKLSKNKQLEKLLKIINGSIFFFIFTVVKAFLNILPKSGIL